MFFIVFSLSWNDIRLYTGLVGQAPSPLLSRSKIASFRRNSRLARDLSNCCLRKQQQKLDDDFTARSPQRRSMGGAARSLMPTAGSGAATARGRMGDAMGDGRRVHQTLHPPQNGARGWKR